MSSAPKPLPLLTDTNRFFWTSGADGVLRLLQCGACASYVHPPQPVCRECRSDDVRPAPLSGRATVLGWTVNHQPWHPAFEPPYVIAVVAFEEDPTVRLTTNLIEAEPESIAIGMAVEVVFREEEDAWIPVFRPVGDDR
ncbi:MAG: OB-fold domain-containing protein [Acidimicrobiales bacterium]|nr:OB-fold domain-containing protein [Acidimicrobiales bacterium]